MKPAVRQTYDVVLSDGDDASCSITFVLTEEGLIVDLYGPTGLHVATYGQTAQEWAERMTEDGQ